MTHCIKCGKRVCPHKAMFYKVPLCHLCNSCRAKELWKKEKEKKSGAETKISSDPEK